MFRTEHNLETGEIVEIPLTTPEKTELEKSWAAEAARIKAEEDALLEKEAQKAALLERLGITEEEAKLLLQ